MKRILVVLTVLTCSFAISAFAADVQWGPLIPRISTAEYTLPEGLLEAIKADGTKELTAYNWGEMEYDPATVLNGEEYEKMTGVKINFVGTPDEQMQPKLQALFMARSPAVDIVPLDETIFVNFAKAGWLEPVDFLWDDESLELYSAGLKGAIIDGHHYSTPQVGRIVDMLYYRPSMLKEAGYDAPPKTWAEFDEMAQKLTIDKDGDGTIDQWGYAFRGGGVLDGALTLKAGSLLLGVNPDDYQGTGKKKWNDPATVQYVERLVKMRNEWKVVPEGVTAYQHGDVADLFLSGNVAMVIDPTYLYARCAADESPIKDDFAVAIQPLAKEGGPRTMIMHWNGWAVSKFSKHKTAAFGWLDWYRSWPAQVHEFAMENNDIFHLGAYNDPKSQEVPYYGIVQEILKDTVVNLYLNQGAVYKAVIQELQNALTGQKAPQQAMDDAQKKVDSVLKQTW